MTIDNNYLEAKWHQLAGTIKQKWYKLTDNDMEEIKGREEVMIGKLQELYNLSYDEAKKEVEDFKNESFRTEQA